VSVRDSRACCVGDAQYSRLQDMMAKIEEASPEDVVALMRKCVEMFSRDIIAGELRSVIAADYRDIEVAAGRGPSLDGPSLDGPSLESLK